jgi:putative tryptophan/tyrosine transport system substrate-binding protein
MVRRALRNFDPAFRLFVAAFDCDDWMKRREVIGFLGVTLTAWSLVVRGQQLAIPTVGFLGARAAKDSADLVAAFREGLNEGGFVEDRNVAIEFRWEEGHYERYPTLCAELLARRVAVIVATASAPALVAKSATTKIPIIFLTGVDPVQFGLVKSFGRPEGNVTGVASLGDTLAPKQLELLLEIVPRKMLVAYLVNPTNLITETDTRNVRSALSARRQELLVVNASSENDLDSAFATLVRQKAGALLVQNDPYLNAHPERIVALAAIHGIPAVYQYRVFAVAGGLMSYGTVLTDAYRQLGVYASKILRGAKPSDLPVWQSVKVELVVNLKTAKALGITIPPSLLARADEVIP